MCREMRHPPSLWLVLLELRVEGDALELLQDLSLSQTQMSRLVLLVRVDNNVFYLPRNQPCRPPRPRVNVCDRKRRAHPLTSRTHLISP